MELYDYLVLAGTIVAFLLVVKVLWSRIHNGNATYSYHCNWKYNDEGYYDTNCNEVFMFTEGSLDNNDKFMFCPYCSRKIRTKFFHEED